MQRFSWVFTFAMVAPAMVEAAPASAAGGFDYPEAERQAVFDEYHGVTVADP